MSIRRSAFLIGISLVSGLLISASALGAHDFWLVPDAFRVGRGDTITVRGRTSSLFPTSVSAVTTDRVADARLIGGKSSERITGLSQSGTSLLLRHRVSGSGQRIVAVRLHPRSVRESAESFRRYLVLEGAPEALARYEREGKLPVDSVTRRYTKYAKTIVEVGARGSRAFARRAGHPLEIVPMSDPSSIRPGGRLRVLLLAGGVPVSDAHLHAGSIADDLTIRDDTLSARSASASDAALVTDKSGRAEIRITRAGLWNIRTLHIVPSRPGSGADWDVHWATLVFRPGR